MTQLRYGTHDGVSLSGAENDVLLDEYQSTLDELESSPTEDNKWHFRHIAREIEKRNEQGRADGLPRHQRMIDDYDEVMH